VSEDHAVCREAVEWRDVEIASLQSQLSEAQERTTLADLRAANITQTEANRLQDVLRTLTASGPALLTSARELVRRYEAAESALSEMRERAEQAGRVPCRGCNGADTAKASGAECYNCRNKPYWELEGARDEIASLRAKVEELEGQAATVDDATGKIIVALRAKVERLEGELARWKVAAKNKVRAQAALIGRVRTRAERWANGGSELYRSAGRTILADLDREGK
jgi:chromosome segregation ATPase